MQAERAQLAAERCCKVHYQHQMSVTECTGQEKWVHQVVHPICKLHCNRRQSTPGSAPNLCSVQIQPAIFAAFRLWQHTSLLAPHESVVHIKGLAVQGQMAVAQGWKARCKLHL